jgi:gas vesicle structural protein
MAIQRSTELLDVMERVLNRGVVIEAWVGVSVAGLRLVDIEARILVASFATYVSLADTIAATQPVITRAPRKPVAPPPSACRSEAQRAMSDTRPRRRAARRRSGPAAARRTWACAQGCTFQRAARWQQAAIPCPYDKGRRCAVQTA